MAVFFSALRKNIPSFAVICDNQRKVFYKKSFNRFTSQILKSYNLAIFYTVRGKSAGATYSAKINGFISDYSFSDLLARCV